MSTRGPSSLARRPETAAAPGASPALGLFSPATRAWFTEAFGEPTAAQEGAWQAIARGEDTLVVAPTGSGKTLAAFLSAIDALQFPSEPAGAGAGAAAGSEEPRRTSVLYVSPLKALGVDVERNLTSPLVGTIRAAERLGLEHRGVSVGVRTGDTTPAERRRLVTHPPDILITTPESLFLMLSSAARETLAGVSTVIVDEVHAVAGTKRGVHLALSLARLDALVGTPAQRIGLSATVEPVEEVSAFLTGSGRGRPVSIVRPASAKRWDVTVRLPVPDLQEIAPPPDAVDEDDVSGTIWPHVERAVLAEVLAHRSTIVFANSRRQAERLTTKLNRLHARRLAEAAESGGAASEPEVPEVPEADEIARAHHGSMSKEHRKQIEERLKAGELRCVVATSSLELGIDMGAVDLVVQVESPFSVSSALQRIGRAGHDVGAVSTGVVHPLHAADVIRAAVTVRESLAGRIEPLAVPRNALDVLAQHTVSAAAMDTLDVEEWFELVRTASPYAALPRSAFDQTMDLLSGRYPSTAFSELRPRLVHDRDEGTLAARPGAQRLVVTSGGTIPDRGLYPVYIVAGEEDTQARRAGELDEEMVYESRRGDVITLGTSSWRIEEITHDRVSVSPAFGLAGRIPFWHGDGVGRPPALGRAIAAFQSSVADLARRDEAAARAELTGLGLDANASGTLITHLREQEEAVGVVPGPDHLVVERFLDELGDWRVVLHCPLGQRITGPWSLAVGARVEERYGLDGQVMAADDGIVLRIPHGEEPPPADLFVFTPEEIDEEVRRLVGTSALFASRFRECAARALLLPRRDPRSRAPLWQQRQRSASLLDVARPFPQFPIMLEAARECLQDVYDLPALVELMGAVAGRRVQVREVETTAPSPFARSLLFGYVSQFIYDADSPLAERRTAALSLDQALLAELLGSVSLRELLDADAIEEVSRRLQGLDGEHPLRGAEDVADALRRYGPLTPAAITERAGGARDVAGTDDAGTDDAGRGVGSTEVERMDVEAAIADLVAAHRAIRVRLAGTEHIAAIEDAGLLRDALGVALPPGIPESHLAEVPRPVEQLVSRWARTRGPFDLAEVTAAFGLAPGVARSALETLTADRTLSHGEFTPGREGGEWTDADVLRRIRRASLAASRREIEPVPHGVYGRFLGQWQHVAPRGADGRRERATWRGADGVLSVIDQLTGVSLPLSAWESQILPARLPDYTPATLDALFASGDVVWTGHGRLGATDGWVRLHLADALPLGLDAAAVDEAAGALTEGSLTARILALLRRSPGALRHGEILTALADEGEAADPPRVGDALWDLSFSSLVTNDAYQVLRTHAMGPAPSGTSRSTGRSRPATRRGAARLSAAMMRAGTSNPSELQTGTTGAGRWSAVRVAPVDASARAAAMATLLLDRHGVVTRGAMSLEDVPGSFAAVYRVLSRLEEGGQCRRGYFVDGLGASQFAPTAAVDLLRDRHREAETGNLPGAVAVLAATDPASPYGAALPWPALAIEPPEGPTVRPARRAGAIVVLRDGEVAAFVEKGGKSLLWFAGEDATAPTARALVEAISQNAVIPLLAIERVNGHGIGTEAVRHVLAALEQAGAYRSPRSLRVRAGGR